MIEAVFLDKVLLKDEMNPKGLNHHLTIGIHSKGGHGSPTFEGHLILRFFWEGHYSKGTLRTKTWCIYGFSAQGSCKSSTRLRV